MALPCCIPRVVRDAPPPPPHTHTRSFLRDGAFNYPADGTDFKYLLELRAEAEFYGLTGLVAQIDRCVRRCVISKVA